MAVNFVEKLTKETFDKVKYIYDRFQAGEMESLPAEDAIRLIIREQKEPPVDAPDWLAFYIVTVVREIVWEEPDSEKWMKTTHGVYVDKPRPQEPKKW